MGWNLFKHNDDGTVTFCIPTEHSDKLVNMLDSNRLHEKVSLCFIEVYKLFMCIILYILLACRC